MGYHSNIVGVQEEIFCTGEDILKIRLNHPTLIFKAQFVNEFGPFIPDIIGDQDSVRTKIKNNSLL